MYLDRSEKKWTRFQFVHFWPTLDFMVSLRLNISLKINGWKLLQIKKSSILLLFFNGQSFFKHVNTENLVNRAGLKLHSDSSNLLQSATSTVHCNKKWKIPNNPQCTALVASRSRIAVIWMSLNSRRRCRRRLTGWSGGPTRLSAESATVRIPPKVVSGFQQRRKSVWKSTSGSSLGKSGEVWL